MKRPLKESSVMLPVPAKKRKDELVVVPVVEKENKPENETTTPVERPKPITAENVQKAVQLLDVKIDAEKKNHDRDKVKCPMGGGCLQIFRLGTPEADIRFHYFSVHVATRILFLCPWPGCEGKKRSVQGVVSHLMEQHQVGNRARAERIQQTFQFVDRVSHKRTNTRYFTPSPDFINLFETHERFPTTTSYHWDVKRSKLQEIQTLLQELGVIPAIPSAPSPPPPPPPPAPGPPSVGVRAAVTAVPAGQVEENRALKAQVEQLQRQVSILQSENIQLRTNALQRLRGGRGGAITVGDLSFVPVTASWVLMRDGRHTAVYPLTQEQAGCMAILPALSSTPL